MTGKMEFRRAAGSAVAALMVFAALLLIAPRFAVAHCDEDKDGAACKASGHGRAAAATAGADQAAAIQNAKLNAAPGEQVYVLGIEGMSCPEGCPPKVKESLESIEGVHKVEVDFADKRAIVTTAADVDLNTAEVDKSFKNQGYFVSSLEKVPAK